MFRRILVLTAVLLLLGSLLTAQELPRVLVLNSYHDGFDWSDGIMQGVEASLKNKAQLYIEYMDTKRFTNNEVNRIFLDFIDTKYSLNFFDAIITTDDNALLFLLEFHDRLFPGVPSVFCGVNGQSYDLDSFRRWLTGTYEENDLQGTLSSAFTLLPATDTVYVVTDNTTSGLAQEEAFRKIHRTIYPDIRFEFLNRDRLISLQRVEEVISNAAPESIVYFSDLYLDGKMSYQDFHTYLQPLTAQAPVPFFSHAEFFLGLGIAGGSINYGFHQGEYAGGIVKRFISGETPDMIQINKNGPHRYTFDAGVLKRFNIQLSRLPAESLLINDEQTPMALLLRFVVPLSTGLLFFAGLSIIFFINIRRRIHAEKLLAREQVLISALLENIPDFIYFKDREGQYLKINTALADYYGIEAPENAVGNSDTEYYKAEVAQRTRRDEVTIISTGTPMIDREELISRPGQETHWLTSTKLPLHNEYGEIIGTFGISRDITERKMQRERIQESLKEKDLLLREINHRVKNNLAIISSLISLQQQNSPIDSPEAILDELRSRILSISLVHERLYRSENFTSVSIEAYLEELTSSIESIFNSYTDEVQVTVDTGEIRVPIDTAIPLGLIFNELLTNSFKHAFKNSPTKKSIKIAGETESEQMVFLVQDNGCGYPPEFSPGECTSMGFTLINALLTQINGSIEIGFTGGAWSRITLPVSETGK